MCGGGIGVTDLGMSFHFQDADTLCYRGARVVNDIDHGLGVDPVSECSLLLRAACTAGWSCRMRWFALRRLRGRRER